ncbi:hypothetical protein J6590_084841 [Homalodisca vitripennis]|nr:hypothetical protein J6590_084841 [Homalodisca vitripennis]
MHVKDFIIQQDRISCHWSRQVREYLNETEPLDWFSKSWQLSMSHLGFTVTGFVTYRPHRSFDFFLQGFIKDKHLCTTIPTEPGRVEEPYCYISDEGHACPSMGGMNRITRPLCLLKKIPSTKPNLAIEEEKSVVPWERRHSQNLTS